VATRLDEAITVCLNEAATADDPGAAWVEAVEREVRPAMLHVVVDAANETLTRMGGVATDGLATALAELAAAHVAAIVAYRGLIDGVVFGGDDEKLARVLAVERAAHVGETEARHARSGVIALCATLLGEPT
jgi:hypothetical protein